MQRAVCFILVLAAFCGVVSWPLAAADDARLVERSLGSETAPVTIVEYSSLTCSHCAAFHRDTLPRIKAEYIDTGKLRLVFSDFPLEPRALAASAIARCVDPSRYFGFVDLLFRDQQAWATAADPLKELKVRARLANLSESDVDACLNDRALLASLQRRRDQAAAERGIESTPTFFVNGRMIKGNLPFETFREAIETALKGTSAPAVPPWHAGLPRKAARPWSGTVAAHLAATGG